MRLRSTLLAATLVGTLVLAACGSGRVGGASSADDTTESARTASGPAGTEIPDDFPLSAGMGGPEDTIPTSRTGTGLRDLTICGSAPLRGLGTRDRLIADNSGGEAANTRELLLLGSPDEAARVARAFTDPPPGCTAPAGDMQTDTEVRESPFGPAPAGTLVQTYTFDGEPGEGATVIHVVPVGAALLVTSTYGQWTDATLEDGVAETVEAVRRTVAALAQFGDGSTPSSPAPSSEPSPSAQGVTAIPEVWTVLERDTGYDTVTVGRTFSDGLGSSVFQVTRVGSARLMVHAYGEGSLASLASQADEVTGTTEEIVPAMCVFTRTGC